MENRELINCIAVIFIYSPFITLSVKVRLYSVLFISTHSLVFIKLKISSILQSLLWPSASRSI